MAERCGGAVVGGDDQQPLEEVVLEECCRQRLAGEGCDVSLRVNLSVFKVHRKVLAAASAYFNAMFNGSWAEGHVEEVVLHEVEAETVEQILEYMYSGHVIKFTKTNAFKILFASHFYRMEILQRMACSFLEKNIYAANCVRVLCIADLLSSAILKQLAIDFLIANFTEVATFNGLEQLPRHLLIEVISADCLNVESEESLCRFIFPWLTVDGTRDSDFHQVLEHVRLPFLSMKFLHDFVADQDVVKNSIECRDLVEEALWYHVLPDARPNRPQNERTRPRPNTVGPREKITYALSSCGTRIFDMRSGKWKPAVPVAGHCSVSKFAIAQIGDILYVAGGLVGRKSRSNAFFYSSSLGCWRHLANMKKKRSDFTLLSAGGCLYAIGGANLVASDIEKYTPSLDRWDVIESVTSLSL